jgi:hypothetical protein
MSITLVQSTGTQAKGANFFKDWENVVNDLGAKTVLFCDVDYCSYDGWLEFDILLDDGRVISYAYGFDSCCDRLCGADKKKIKEDIKQESTFFDNIEQYDAWVDTLPKSPSHYYCEERQKAKSNRKEINNV